MAMKTRIRWESAALLHHLLSKHFASSHATCAMVAADSSCDHVAGGKDDDEEEDIGAQLGVGGIAADAELDALKEAAEAEIVSANNLLGCYAPLLAAICHNRYG